MRIFLSFYAGAAFASYIALLGAGYAYFTRKYDHQDDREDMIMLSILSLGMALLWPIFLIAIIFQTEHFKYGFKWPWQGKDRSDEEED